MQQKDWPNFTYSLQALKDDLFTLVIKSCHITGVLKVLPEETQVDAIVDTMVAGAIKASEIAG